MIIVPVILTVLFLVIHFAVLGHASHVAQIAAQRGAQVAASSNGSVDEIQRAVQQASVVVNDLGAHLNAVPIVRWSGQTVGVTVRISTQKLVPFLPHEVSRTVWATQEVFLREQDR